MQDKRAINPQLAEIKSELDDVSRRAAALINTVDVADLKQRPQPDKWSIIENLVHLNLSSEAEIEEIDGVLEQRRPGKFEFERPYNMDLLGRFLKWTLEPPMMFFSKLKTIRPLQPFEVEPVGEVLPTFLRLQEELKKRVDMAAGLPLDRIKIASPYDRRVKYNLFSFFHILLAHERRHLWQAELVKDFITR